MKKAHKLTALFLAVVFCAMMLTQASASFSSSDSSTVQAKISSTLLDEVQTSGVEKIPTVVWLTDIDMDSVEEAAKSACTIDNSSPTRSASQNEGMSTADVQVYIATKRAIAAETYKSQNQSVANSLFNRDDILFVSKYSPMIVVNMSKEDVFTAAQSEEVLSIYYYQEPNLEESASTRTTESMPVKAWTLPMVNDITRVTDTHESSAFGYTGAGIKIGIFEVNLPTASSFGHINLTTHSLGAEGTNSSHADAVLTIISSIAPDAEYFATSYSADYTPGTIFARIEWLVEQEVNIINSSRSLSGTVNDYDYIAQWVDHISYQHNIHFVQSPGDHWGEIDSAGLAYNAVTVGGIDIGSNFLTLMSNFVISDASGRYHGEDDGFAYAFKPDLCAPGETFYIEETEFECEGTSFSVPQVTGVIALLCEQRPALKEQQKLVKAILAASVNFDCQLRYVPENPEYKTYGAGLLDCLGACWVVGNYRYASGSMPANGTDRTHTFTVTSSDTRIRVALSWNIKSLYTGENHSTLSSADTALPDLNLKVIDPNGNDVMSSTTTNNNVEIVDFVPTMTGTYTIVVICGDNVTRTVPYSLAWR